MLSLKGISKTYYLKKARPVEALKNINLDFQDKGMVFILGKSGSGKSTLLNVIGGLDKPDKGSIDIYGKSSTYFSQSDFDSYRNTYVGFIFQEYNILEEFTVGENIELAMQLQGKKADSQSLNSILEEVDLSGYASRKPNELSGGQMQRVAIARALIKNPEIILADEPTGALDSNTGKQVFETLKKLSRDKLVIIISHDREFAERYGDRVIELADGVIISDITKKTTNEETKEEGLTIYDNKVIYIKQGYQITNKDLETINNLLKSNTNNETIISIDEKANEQVMKTKGIKKEGNREVFEQTDFDRLDIKEYDKNKFKLLKSKLPFKNSLKMAFSSLKTKPVRLFFTILLSTVAFTLFGLANTFSNYDKTDATVNSIKDYNIDYLTIDKSVKITDEYGYDYYESINSTKEDIKFLEKEYRDINFKPLFASDISVYNSTSNSYYDYLNDTQAISDEEFGTNVFYTNTVYGYMNINEEDLKSFGFEIVGKLPKELNEIALTEYAYLHFEKCGYVDTKRDIKIETVSKKEDLIGKYIKLDVEGTVKEFVITAIVDTKFDTTRYDLLKEPMNFYDSDISQYLRESEFYMVLENSYHSVAFVSEKLINETYFKEDVIRLGDMGENQTFLIDKEGDEFTFSFKSSYGKYLLSSEKAIEANMFFIQENKESLNNNEVLFSELDFVDLFNQYDGLEKAKDSFSNKALEILKKYSKDRISEFSPSNDENEYFEYLLNNLDKENKYGKDAKDILNESLKEIILFIAKDINLKSHYSKPGYTNSIFDPNMNYKEVEFAGYYISEGLSYYYWDSKINILQDNTYIEDVEKEKTEDGYSYEELSYTSQEQTIIATSDFIEKNNINGKGTIRAFVAKMPTDKGDIRKVVEEFYKDDDNDINYDIQNEVIFTVNNIHEIISVFSKIFIGAGIFFAIFASLLLMNFIATSISRKKREIGILRAVGARGRDVFGIFFKESIIIAIINWLIAVGFTAFLVFLLNNIFEKEFQLLITVLNFGIIQVVTIMLISLFVAFLSSFLPVIRISRKKPIDAIRNH